ncbi:MAG: tail fiber domain-containing protein, partial [Planctomycetota bacterium]
SLRVKALGITNAMLAGSIASTKLAELNNFDTDDLSEGASNLYYTDARARASVSATDAGGDGSFAYNSSTGVFTYTGPSAAEARAHFSATDAGGDGSFAYDSGTGVFTYTGPSAAEVRAHLSVADSNSIDMSVADGQFSADAKVDDSSIEIDASNGLQVKALGITNAMLAGSIASTKLAELNNFDTADLAEGANLYYTDARARASVSVTDAGGDGSMAYDSATGVITYTGPSAAEVRAHFSGSAGIDLSAGAIAANVDDSSIEISADALQVKALGITNAMLAGSIASTKIAELNNFDTADLAEGTNLYYTDARARAAVSVTDAGGDGSMAYDSGTGVITYTGPSAAEVRAHLSVADSNSIDMSVADGQFSADAKVDDSSIEIDASNGLQVKALGITNAMLAGSIASAKIAELNNFDTADLAEGANLYYTDARARAAVSVTDAGGDGSMAYNSTTGVLTYTGPSAAEVRAHFTAGDGLAVAAGDFSVNVDDSSLEIDSDSLRVKALGITNAMLSGSIANAKLVNDSVTLTAGAGMAAIGEVDLGASITVAVDGVLEDLDTLGAASADGEFIVATGAGAFAYESGDTARTSLGLGTGDSPAFASLQVSDLTEGRVTFAGASGELADSANMTFNGSALAIVGQMSASSNVSIGGAAVFGVGVAASGIAGDDGTPVFGIPQGGKGRFFADLQVDGGLSVAGGYGSTGLSVTGAGGLSMNGSLQVDGRIVAGADGAGSDLEVFGASANEKMMFDASENTLFIQNASGNTILTLGGDDAAEFAVDVANGSDNANKIRAAAFVTYSDESLKTDVATMDTALDTIMSLNGVEFTWKNDGERDFGFIAQEVAEVLPKAVHTNDGISGVDYSRLTSVLVEAVKAQQVQIEDLKKALKK